MSFTCWPTAYFESSVSGTLMSTQLSVGSCTATSGVPFEIIEPSSMYFSVMTPSNGARISVSSSDTSMFCSVASACSSFIASACSLAREASVCSVPACAWLTAACACA